MTPRLDPVLVEPFSVIEPGNGIRIFVGGGNGWTKIEDRLFPNLIIVNMPGGTASGQPTLDIVIEVIDGVPTCTALSLKMGEGGRGVMQKDLRGVELDYYIEAFSGLVARPIIEERVSVLGKEYVFSPTITPELSKEGHKIATRARYGKKKTGATARLRRVADAYNNAEGPKIDAVMDELGVSKSTAIRRIKEAKEAGLIKAGQQ